MKFIRYGGSVYNVGVAQSIYVRGLRQYIGKYTLFIRFAETTSHTNLSKSELRECELKYITSEKQANQFMDRLVQFLSSKCDVVFDVESEAKMVVTNDLQGEF